LYATNLKEAMPAFGRELSDGFFGFWTLERPEYPERRRSDGIVSPTKNDPKRSLGGSVVFGTGFCRNIAVPAESV